MGQSLRGLETQRLYEEWASAPADQKTIKLGLLINALEYFIRWNVGKVHSVGRRRYELDEIESEIKSRLLVWLTKYDPAKARITTFVAACISQERFRMLRKLDRSTNDDKLHDREESIRFNWSTSTRPDIHHIEIDEFNDHMKQAVSLLNDIELVVMRHRFQGLNNNEIGKIIGFSRERVRQIFWLGVEKIRESMATTYGDIHSDMFYHVDIERLVA